MADALETTHSQSGPQNSSLTTPKLNPKQETGGNDRFALLRKEHIRAGLSSNEPYNFILELQRQRGLRLEGCEPALELLNLLEVPRGELFANLLHELLGKLVARIKTASKTSLTLLLRDTLPFLAVQELKTIPLTALSSHPEPPASVLRELSEMDKDVVSNLPRHTRQRMWELFEEKFQEHMAPLVSTYVNDYATMVQSDEMYPNLPTIPRSRRSKNKTLHQIVEAIGSSTVLYHRTVDMIRTRYAQTGNRRLCALRADILMMMHDMTVQAIYDTDPCHMFAWQLDAYIKQIKIKLSQGGIALKDATNHLSTLTSELQKLSRKDFAQTGSGLGSRGGGRGHMGRAGATGIQSDLFQQSGAALTIDGIPLGTLPIPNVTLRSVMLEALKKIKREDKFKEFQKPVVELYPELLHAYPMRVKKPMDLRTIQTNIEEGKYEGFDDLRNDLALIADNCATFNGADHLITQRANKIMKERAAEILENAKTKLSKAHEEDEMRKHEQSRQAKLEREKKFAEEEAEYLRGIRSICDASMILASGHAINVLLCSLFLALGSEVIKNESLPRDGQTVRDLIWMLQIAEQSQGFAKKQMEREEIAFEPLRPDLERIGLPLIIQVQLDGIEYRTAKPDVNGKLNLDPYDPKLFQLCKSSWLIRHCMLHFLCSRVRLRDHGLIIPLFDMAADLGKLVTDHEGFLHSLVTGFHLSSLSPKRTQSVPSSHAAVGKSAMTGRKRQPNRSMDAAFQALPQLPPSIRKKAMETFFLPSILEATEEFAKCKADTGLDGKDDVQPELEDHRIQLSLVHAHFARFITLESSLKSLGMQEVTSLLQRAILPLSLAPKSAKTSEILQSQERRAMIFEFYSCYEFRRARRYYTKIFERFPSLQTACGIDISRVASTPGNPSPSPTPSPGSNSGTPSQFDASPSPSLLPSSSPSPSLGASSDNNSTHGGGHGSPRATSFNDDSVQPRKQPRLE